MKACRPHWIALLQLADAARDVEPEALRDVHHLVPGAGGAPIGQWIGLIRQLGVDPAAVVPVAPAGDAEPTAWARRLRECALSVAREPRGGAR